MVCWMSLCLLTVGDQSVPWVPIYACYVWGIFLAVIAIKFGFDSFELGGRNVGEGIFLGPSLVATKSPLSTHTQKKDKQIAEE